MAMLNTLITRFTDTAGWVRRDRSLYPGEVASDSEKGIIKVGPGPFSSRPGIGHCEVYDIRDYGPALANGMNITQHFVGAFNDAPIGGTILIPEGDFILAPVTINKPVVIRGAGSYLTRIRALAGSTGWLFTLTDLGAPAGSTAENHIHGFDISGLFLDGGGRVDDIGLIKMTNVDRSIFRDMRLGHARRSALDLTNSVRESVFTNIYTRHCGTPGTYPQVNILNSGTRDGANNLHFTDCWFIYPHGTNVLVGNSNIAKICRNIAFTSCMFHGKGQEEDSSLVTDGYTYDESDETMGAGPTIDARDVRGLTIDNSRVHNPGTGYPNLMLSDRAVGGGVTEVAIDQGWWGFGAASTARTFTVAANVATSTAHKLWTGALIRLTNSGGALPTGLATNTDYWVIRLGPNTFSFASSYLNALNGVVVALSSTGTGTHSAQPQDHHVQVNYGSLRIGPGLRFESGPARGNIVYKSGRVYTNHWPLNYDIRRFGAVCDGVTDDRAAILAAITACQEDGGGDILLPPLPIGFTGIIDVGYAVNLVGSYGGNHGGTNAKGSRFIALDASAQIRIGHTNLSGGSSPSRGGHSRDFAIDGRGVGGANANGGGLLYIYHAVIRTFTNIHVFDSAGIGIRIDHAQNNSFNNMGSFRCVDTLYHIDRGAANNTFTACTGRQTGRRYVYFGNTASIETGTYGNYTFGNRFVGGIFEDVLAGYEAAFEGTFVQEGTVAQNSLSGVTIVGGSTLNGVSVRVLAGTFHIGGQSRINPPATLSGVYVEDDATLILKDTDFKDMVHAVVVADTAVVRLGDGVTGVWTGTFFEHLGSVVNVESFRRTQHRHIIPNAHPRWRRLWREEEAQPRLIEDYVGTGPRWQMGDGTVTPDTNLYRSGVDTLRTDGLFRALALRSDGTAGAGYLEMQTQSATPATPAAGGVRIFFRVNGATKIETVLLYPSGVTQVIFTEP
jgi:hypothetical protein